jgi:acetyl esterase/lipase
MLFLLRAWSCLLLLGAVCCSPLAAADDPATILLWPDGAPGKVGDEETDKPLLWYYPAPKDKTCGTAVVVCPGGGYGALAVDHEGAQVARWFNSFGVTAFVLKYRLAPRYRHPAPMDDVQRALQYVRSNATKYDIAPHRIGVMGFSAGGHLASTAATHHLDAQADSPDPARHVSSRPDFAILCYPVITMSESWGHRGSRNNLLGNDPSPELADLMSSDKQVSDKTPPTFLFHTAEDSGVPVENSLSFYAAMRKHKVPGEMHIYQFGPHGVGLAPGDPALSTWKERLHDWLRNSGFLADVKRAAVKGLIRVNGQPIKWGQVRFTPRESPEKPVSFGMVRNGSFSIAADRGPVLGLNSVTVYTMGDVVPHPTVTDAQVVTSTARGQITFDVREANNELNLELPE